MSEMVYERLAEALASRGGAMPALKCNELFALLKELFSPEEAELAAKMPLSPIPAETLAKEFTEGDSRNVENLLEAMANRGLVFSFKRNDVMFYTLMPLVPGIFEMQFMSGEVSERTKRLARLFDNYFSSIRKVLTQPSQDTSGSYAAVPFARVIPVEEEIPIGAIVHPYDRVSEYIEKADYIAVGVCYCRHHGELLGHPCDKPKDVCMAFGPQARYVAERGFGKLISKEEALQILDRAEEAGLVHCSSNTGKYINFICNCCNCHCGIIQSMRRGVVPMGAVSSFIVTVDEDKCSGCGICIDRCQMDALTLDATTVVRNVKRCIGCGLCVSVCPTQALKLEPRKDAPVPPRDQRELNAAMMSSL